MKYLKTKFASYCFGMLIGMISTMLLFGISFEASINKTYQSYEQSVNKEIKAKNFYDDNKDYIIAGLLLNDQFHEPIVEKLGGKKEFESYYKRDISPIYRSKVKDLFKNFNTKDFGMLIKDNVSKIKDLIRNNIESLLKYINKNILKIKQIIVAKKSEVIRIIGDIKYELIEMLKEFISDYLPNLSDQLKQKLKLFIEKNKENLILALKKLPKKVKKEIIDYLQENKDEIIDQVIEYLFDNSEKIKNLLIKIFKNSDIFINADDDYNFTSIEINGNEVDLSFLNILDIEIEDAVYENNSTIFNVKDDTLKISKVYINFESLDSKGVDIMTGHVDIKGIKAKIFYELIEDFNAFI